MLHVLHDNGADIPSKGYILRMSPLHELLALSPVLHERIRRMPGAKLWNLMGDSHQPVFLSWRAFDDPPGIGEARAWVAVPADPRGLLHLALDVCQQAGMRALYCSLQENAECWVAQVGARKPDTGIWRWSEQVDRVGGLDDFGGPVLACTRVVRAAWNVAGERGWKGKWDDAVDARWG